MNLDEYIEPFFQPIIWSKGTGTYAHEALFRFKGMETLPAGLFRRWERSGYVATVDCAIVRRVRAALHASRGSYRVAVNVSARTLALAGQEYFGELLVLAKRAKRVIVEITETYPIEDPKVLADFVRRCKAHGMYVAFDDCKPPHEFCDSAFTSLVKPNFLKIDGELLNECFTDQVLDPISHVVQLARSIGAVVIAEWIDGPAKSVLATTLGADMLQGDWIAKPSALAQPSQMPVEVS